MICAQLFIRIGAYLSLLFYRYVRKGWQQLTIKFSYETGTIGSTALWDYLYENSHTDLNFLIWSRTEQ